MNTDPSVSEPTISFPEAQASQPQMTAAAARRSAVRMLVIDDEPEIWRAVRAGLVSAGFTTEWAETGAEGIDLVARWRSDVVILDLTLPDLDGIEVCRRLRNWSQVPMIHKRGCICCPVPGNTFTLAFLCPP